MTNLCIFWETEPTKLITKYHERVQIKIITAGVSGTGQAYSVGADGIGEECLWELAGLVKAVCRNWRHSSRVSEGVDGTL